MPLFFRTAFLILAIHGIAFFQELPVTKVAEWGAGRYQDIVVEGNIAYVAASYGLEIVDVRDPSNPVKLGSSDLPRRSTAIRVGGRYAYLAAYNGLNVLDVSNPASPELKAVFAVGAEVRDLALKIPYLFIVVPAGLQILDISNPTAPFRVAEFTTPAETKNLSLEGNLACLATPNGLVVVDISNPAAPVSRSVVSVAEPALKVQVRNGKAYLAYQKPNPFEGGLHIFDLSDPGSPQRLGTLISPSSWSISWITGEFAVSDNYAFILQHCYYSGTSGSWSWEALALADISDPTHPMWKSSSGYGAGNKLFLSGAKMYVVYTQGSFTIYDVSDPPAGRLLGQYAGGGGDALLSVAGGYVDFSFDHGPVQIMDPKNFSVVGHAGYQEHAFFSGQKLLYSINGGVIYDRVTRRYFLSMYDVSDPFNIRQLGSLQVLEGVYLIGTWDIHAAEDKVFIVFNSSPAFAESPNKKAMIIVDTSDPQNPKIAGTMDFVDPPKAVFAAGHLAYVAFGEAGVRIYDVSNLAAPNLIGALDTPGSANDVFLSGTSAFVADGPGGICIIDVSNPAKPVFLGSYDTAGNAQGVYADGNLAYLADGDNGLLIFDVSSPNTPRLVGSYGIFGDAARQVSLCGSYIFVAAGKLYALYQGLDTPPTVVIKAPGRHTVFGDVKIAAELKDDKGIARLDLYLDAALVQTAFSPPPSYEYLWNTRTWADGACSIKIRVTDTSGKTSEDEVTVSVNNTNPPRLVINLTKLVFGASQNGPQTNTQSIIVSNGGGGTIHWTASWPERWIHINYPTSGAGSGRLDIWVDPSGLGPGSYAGTVLIEDPGALNSPQFVSVTLNVYAAGSTSPPFGWFDSPLDGATRVEGAIPVTGWALDDVGIDNLKIYREAVDGEGPLPDGLIYIGEAIFIEGARPDVERAFPNFPANHRAGWGYMLLTNCLPRQGNGIFRIHAVARDREGTSVDLGVKTISCDNANATLPFGTIDTPAQGENITFRGEYANFGWVLTPQPKYVPTDGSTIIVWVDGKPLGHPVYNFYRSDIVSFFPGFANSNGAVGYFRLDASLMSPGTHTIAWSVQDSQGKTSGIGSRYFSVVYAGGVSAAGSWNMPSSLEKGAIGLGRPIRAHRGYDVALSPDFVGPDSNGTFRVEMDELDRVVCLLDDGPIGELTGYMRLGNDRRPLPPGVTMDPAAASFVWQPGPGFIGDYTFVICFRDQAGIDRIVNIRLTIRPKRGEESPLWR